LFFYVAAFISKLYQQTCFTLFTLALVLRMLDHILVDIYENCLAKTMSSCSMPLLTAAFASAFFHPYFATQAKSKSLWALSECLQFFNFVLMPSKSPQRAEAVQEVFNL